MGLIIALANIAIGGDRPEGIQSVVDNVPSKRVGEVHSMRVHDITPKGGTGGRGKTSVTGELQTAVRVKESECVVHCPKPAVGTVGVNGANQRAGNDRHAKGGVGGDESEERAQEVEVCSAVCSVSDQNHAEEVIERRRHRSVLQPGHVKSGGVYAGEETQDVVFLSLGAVHVGNKENAGDFLRTHGRVLRTINWRS